MSFANHNILDIALSMIPSTVVQIRKNLGTTVNKYGQSVANYGEWIEVYGIVQPGSEQNEHTEGMDFSKKRVTIWLRGVALDGTHIQWAPDQIRYVGKIFNVTGVKDWFPYDNYRECECVEVLNLDERQRGIASQAPKASRKGRKKESSLQPELPLEMSPAPSNTSPIKKKPTIFCPAESSSQVAPPQESETTEAPVDTSLVGKARIRF